MAYFQNKKCSKSINLSIRKIFKCARANACAIFYIIFLEFWKNHHFFMFFGGLVVMNSFVTSVRDIDMFSKRNMFKINPTFPQENFHVRASECARYILHHLSKVVKNSTFFIVFIFVKVTYFCTHLSWNSLVNKKMLTYMIL